MLSRPAVPLVELIHSSPIRRKRLRGLADGTEDGIVSSTTTTADGPPASLRIKRPSRSTSQPALGAIVQPIAQPVAQPVEPTSRPVPTNLFRKESDSKSKVLARQAPPILPEANPGVRTVWDEDWPHHSVTASKEPQDPKSHKLDANTRDWAYTSAAGPSRTFVPSSQGPIASPVGSEASQSPGPAPIASVTAALPAPVPVTSLSIGQPVVLPPLVTNESSVNQVPVVLPPAVESPVVQRVNVRTTRSLSSPLNSSDESPAHFLADANSSTRGVYTRTQASGRDYAMPSQWGADKYDNDDYIADDLRRTGTATLKDGHDFNSLLHRPQPIARNWSTPRKRFVAMVACLNTALIGLIVGIYAGEVPAIQYALADQRHRVIMGNVVLYLAMGTVVLLFWPLPLLHGRKTYTLAALAVALPLQIPQAIVVDQPRGTNYGQYTAGLLVARGLSGFCLGFAHINFLSTLLDLFGASLQSEVPHGEVVVTNDIRRHGGGMGLWLGFWSFCFIGSLSLGFLFGADIISGINISWGFYICTILIACVLLLNVITPETRRSQHRRTMQEVKLGGGQTTKIIGRGEIKMHVFGEGPKWWWEEVFAGICLSVRMVMHTGFLVIALYMAWIYAEVVLIIVLLGNLLSAGYRWRPEYVGLGVLSVAVGALLAVPVSKANIFSRARSTPARTDSMTFERRITWTSHLVRRVLFMVTLPIAGLAYTLASRGDRTVHYMVPIVFAAVIGYISNLAISECNGIIMETFDTSDLQPGTNNRHRLQSLPPSEASRRTAYSCFPRVCAGFFVSQGLGFLLAAAATRVGGAVTRKIGAQKATAITAGILMALTLLLSAVLWRYKVVQVIPNELFGHYFGSLPPPGSATGTTTGASTNIATERRASVASAQSDASWRAVVIGFPSGKTRRMSWLELGSLSRWTEIRRLNRLLNRSTTQALNPGWR